MKKPEIAIVVDGATWGNPGRFEYRGLTYPKGSQLFHFGSKTPYQGTNNIAEFLAIVHALSLKKEQPILTQLDVYSDSQTAIHWVNGKRVNTKCYLFLDMES